VHLAGLTYGRSITGVGNYLHPTYTDQDSGYHRSFAPSEVEIAATMAAYVAAGMHQPQRTTVGN
jgi:hypothetical protein